MKKKHCLWLGGLVGLVLTGLLVTDFLSPPPPPPSKPTPAPTVSQGTVPASDTSNTEAPRPVRRRDVAKQELKEEGKEINSGVFEFRVTVKPKFD